jgi:hypothetical protein
MARAEAHRVLKNDYYHTNEMLDKAVLTAQIG